LFVNALAIGCVRCTTFSPVHGKYRVLDDQSRKLVKSSFDFLYSVVVFTVH